jgi:HEAT repeat protein
VLKEKEIKQMGEYRTQRLVLAAWDRLERELGPAVVRNYREEMEGEGRSQKSEVRSQRSEQSVARPTTVPVAKAAPVARSEQPAGQTSVKRVADAPIPVMAAPQGSYSEKLSRIMALKRQATPEAIGEMVAALGDADERIRWLAGSALASLKDERVAAAVRVFAERTESVEGREAAQKLLVQLTHSPVETQT